MVNKSVYSFVDEAKDLNNHKWLFIKSLTTPLTIKVNDENRILGDYTIASTKLDISDIYAELYNNYLIEREIIINEKDRMEFRGEKLIKEVNVNCNQKNSGDEVSISIFISFHFGDSNLMEAVKEDEHNLYHTGYTENKILEKHLTQDGWNNYISGDIFFVKNIFFILLKYLLPVINIFIYFSICVYVQLYACILCLYIYIYILLLSLFLSLSLSPLSTSTEISGHCV